VFVAQQPAAVPVQAYSPYQYVNRRMGDSEKESKDKPAAPAAWIFCSYTLFFFFGPPQLWQASARVPVELTDTRKSLTR
jgi:hypothetical protein